MSKTQTLALNKGGIYSKSDLPKIAYLCKEYGLDSEFKKYPVRLGILAGLELIREILANRMIKEYYERMYKIKIGEIGKSLIFYEEDSVVKL